MNAGNLLKFVVEFFRAREKFLQVLPCSAGNLPLQLPKGKLKDMGRYWAGFIQEPMVRRHPLLDANWEAYSTSRLEGRRLEEVSNQGGVSLI